MPTFIFDKRYIRRIQEDVNRLRPRNRYRYSDVNFIPNATAGEEKAGLRSILSPPAHFYNPLGLATCTGFRPIVVEGHYGSEIVLP